MMFTSVILQSLIACGPKDAPIETAPEQITPSRINTEKPGPLEAPSFTLPELESGELSNGMP